MFVLLLEEASRSWISRGRNTDSFAGTGIGLMATQALAANGSNWPVLADFADLLSRSQSLHHRPTQGNPRERQIIPQP
jgi:hypothetical protein